MELQDETSTSFKTHLSKRKRQALRWTFLHKISGSFSEMLFHKLLLASCGPEAMLQVLGSFSVKESFLRRLCPLPLFWTPLLTRGS